MRIDTSIELTKDNFTDIAWYCSPEEAEIIIETIGIRFEIDVSDVVESIHKAAEKDRYVSDFY